jgi:hypothetical protein
VRRDPIVYNSILIAVFVVSAAPAERSQIKSIFEHYNEIASNEDSMHEVEWSERADMVLVLVRTELSLVVRSAHHE